jgi:hypothetical protein
MEMNDIVNRVWTKTIASKIPTESIEITDNDIRYMWSIIKKLAKIEKDDNTRASKTDST